MKDIYYRIKIDNDVLTLFIFDRDNPIPHTKYKGKINSYKTKIFLSEIQNRIDDVIIKKLLNTIVNN